MALFDLIVDERVAVWRRTTMTVNADSFEQAVNMCLAESTDCATNIIHSDYLDETEEYITPSTEFPCTIEVMDEHYNVIKNNNIYE